MKISYGPLWKTLIDKHMTKSSLREAAELSRTTITKMGKDEPVSLEIVLRIAEALGTREISDILELVDEKPQVTVAGESKGMSTRMHSQVTDGMV